MTFRLKSQFNRAFWHIYFSVPFAFINKLTLEAAKGNYNLRKIAKNRPPLSALAPFPPL